MSAINVPRSGLVTLPRPQTLGHLLLATGATRMALIKMGEKSGHPVSSARSSELTQPKEELKQRRTQEWKGHGRGHARTNGGWGGCHGDRGRV